MYSGIRCFRWLLPFCLILANANQSVAQNAPPAGKNFDLVEQAKSGNAVSQYAVGIEYLLGMGVPRDGEVAVYWIHKSAEQGFNQAQISLGLIYLSGNGVPKNYEAAYFWLSLGASTTKCVGCPPPTDDKTIAVALDRARQNLTAQKRLEIQKSCRKWAETHYGENEANAIGALQTIDIAENTYASNYPEKGYASSLGVLGGTDYTAATSSNALLLDNVLGCASQPCTKRGYSFNISGVYGSPMPTYSAVASPSPGDAGHTFCTDASRVIRYALSGQACNSQSPSVDLRRMHRENLSTPEHHQTTFDYQKGF